MKTAAEHLLELVALPSVSALPNRGVIDYALSQLDPDIWKVRLFPQRDAAGTEKWNLVAATGDEPMLGFVCHTDTVPYEESWGEAIHPVVRDGRLYGRGSCDVKSVLACVLEAVERTRTLKSCPPLLLALTADEEVGCVGARHLASLGAVRARYLIVGEPTSLAPVRGGKGYGLGHIEITGREAHSAFPARGRSAIRAASQVLSALDTVAASLAAIRHEDFDPPYTTVNAGLIEGGSAKNIVPGHCRITVEWRPVPGQQPDLAAQLIREQLSLLNAEWGEGLEARLNVLRVDPAFTPAIGSALADRISALTSRPAATVAFGTEAAHFSPAAEEVVVFGPGDMTVAHKSGEFVPLAELGAATECLMQLISQW